MSASVLKPEEVQELDCLMTKTPARHRYVLVQRASGELVFVQEEIDAMVERAIAAAFGEPKPRRPVIKLDPPRHKGTILAGLIVLTLARAAVAAETVDVKYRGKVDLAPFACVAVSRSTFRNRVCYDRANEYMLISLNGICYHYCEIDGGRSRHS
jgi:hypothetical protein